MQKLKLIPKAVEEEIKRQQNDKKGKGEVRYIKPDGSTEYLRPMPGAARMYVETDHPLIYVSEQELKGIKTAELLDERIVKLEKQYTLSAVVAKEVVGNKLFLACVKKYKVSPSFIAKVLVEMPKEIKTRLKVDSEKLQEKDYHFVLDHLSKKTIPPSAVLEILVQLAEGKKVDVNKYKGVSNEVLEKEIKELVAAKKDVAPNALMGIIMGKYRGKVDGKKVMELLKKHGK